ncbi:uncharacterized protein drongo [Diabrotica undecimpunctata]|uniref:uncharacterized protein drongo n=1 Tax=Diabrotica undecimpunctata TaxID=50387 RepID=UPI003B639EB0
MAASRRKQDEKNLKTLRELGVLLGNKYCFDCNQRGPTYVNVTIGSFVCTKCSGMLRGITPPHRVKSISMATFTNEEIDLLKSRGNDYCRQVWLGLYEGTPPISSGDETSIREFMVEKYERRRYYLDPVNVSVNIKPTEESKTPKVNGIQIQPKQKQRSEISRNSSVDNNNLINNINNNNSSNMNGFVADFDKADIFIGGSTTTLNGSSTSLNGPTTRLQPPQNSFANFDNNPVFNNLNVLANSSTDLQTPAPFNYMNNSWNQPTPVAPPNNSLNTTLSVPSEDRYAALKDLDNEFKSQKNGSLDWSNSSTGSSIPTGSVNSSPSPQPSVFGSHNPGQFMGTFPLHQDNTSNLVSNPFNNNDLTSDINWPNLNPPLQQKLVNPFRDIMKTNGYMQDFHPVGAFPPQAVPFAVNGTNGWTQNPFKVGGTNGMNSNNPFL